MKFDKNTRVLLFGFIILLISGISFSLFNFTITGKQGEDLSELNNPKGNGYLYFKYFPERNEEDRIEGPFEFKENDGFSPVINIELNIENIKTKIKNYFNEIRNQDISPQPSIDLPDKLFTLSLSPEENIEFTIIDDSRERDIKKSELVLKKEDKEDIKLNTKFEKTDLEISGFTKVFWNSIEDYKIIQEDGFGKYELSLILTDKTGQKGEKNIPIDLKDGKRERVETPDPEGDKGQKVGIEVREDIPNPPPFVEDDKDKPTIKKDGCKMTLKFAGKVDEKLKTQKGTNKDELGEYLYPYGKSYFLKYFFEIHANADPKEYLEGQWSQSFTFYEYYDDGYEKRGQKETGSGFNKKDYHPEDFTSDHYHQKKTDLLGTFIKEYKEAEKVIHWTGYGEEKIDPEMINLNKDIKFISAVWKEDYSDYCFCEFDLSLSAKNEKPDKFSNYKKAGTKASPDWKIKTSIEYIKGVKCDTGS